MALCITTDEEKGNIIAAINKTPETLSEDAKILQKWMETQPHLPEIMNENMIKRFIVLNKGSVERTKQKVDMYYTIRSLLPEFYERANPKLAHLQQLQEYIYYCPLPKLTPQLYRVSIGKVRKPAMIDNINPEDLLIQAFNVAEIRLQDDDSFADIQIIDMTDINFSFLVKITPVLIGKLFAIYEGVFSMRLKGIYFINPPSFIAHLINILKLTLKPKIFKRIKLVNEPSELRELIPEEILPRDYGGQEKSLEELQEIVKQRLTHYQERFDKLDNLRVNESLRPEKLTNDDILGFYGNFKKLNVD